MMGLSFSKHTPHGSPPPPLEDRWTRREETVKTLFEMLRTYRLVQVRGTPGSGKSTLMDLLHGYIIQQNKCATVHVIQHWAYDKDPSPYNRRLLQACPTLPEDFNVKNDLFVLWDNAQTTYNDEDLWENYFKTAVQAKRSGNCVILFCSFGSPSNKPVYYTSGTPPILQPSARVSLRPHAECLSVGLLFTRDEFDDVIRRHKNNDRKPIRMDDDLKNMLFEWTAGHAGAIADILTLLGTQRRKERLAGETLTPILFFQENPREKFFTALQTAVNFARGLPQDDEIRHPLSATIFRMLLLYGSISNDNDEVDTSVLKDCIRHGWIHSDLVNGKERYAFASPLHSTYLAWKLLPSEVPPPFLTIHEMSLAVIKQFSRSQLRSPVRIGAAFGDRPLEARYQDEFYRGLSRVTNGGTVVTPEYASSSGSALGRIDFFVPSTRWGIEIMRDGNDLTGHHARFTSSGAYGQWLAGGDMEDYIILDFRTSKPEKPHPEIAKLLHVVFSNDFSDVAVLNNFLRPVDSFALFS